MTLDGRENELCLSPKKNTVIFKIKNPHGKIKKNLWKNKILFTEKYNSFYGKINPYGKKNVNNFFAGFIIDIIQFPGECQM